MTRWRSPWRRLALAMIGVLGLFLVLPSAAVGQDLASLERAVEELEALVRVADFERAIGKAETARRGARNLPRSPASLRAQARLEVLLCTAQVAMGDGAGARSSMQRAVYVWPLLELDPRTTSPRLVKLFRAVRGNGGSARTAP